MKIDFLELIKNTVVVVWDLWPIWLLMLTILGIRLFFDWLGLEIDNWRIRKRFKDGESWRSDRDVLRWLRGMSPAEFEGYIADLFLRLGFKTEAVGKSHDGGIDVVIENDGVKSYIQCKKFINSEVRVGDVRDFYGALVDHLASGKGYFITTNKFTLEAEKFAKDKPIELIDGFKLIKYIHLAEKDESFNKSKIYNALICPKCGGQLLEKHGKFGTFYGCSNYPKCDYTSNKNN